MFAEDSQADVEQLPELPAALRTAGDLLAADEEELLALAAGSRSVPQARLS